MCGRSRGGSGDGDTCDCNQFVFQNVCTEGVSIAGDVTFFIDSINKSTRSAMLCFCRVILSTADFTNFTPTVITKSSDGTQTRRIISDTFEDFESNICSLKSEDTPSRLSFEELNQTLSESHENPSRDQYAVIMSDDEECSSGYVTNGQHEDRWVFGITVGENTCTRKVNAFTSQPDCFFRYDLNTTEEFSDVILDFQRYYCETNRTATRCPERTETTILQPTNTTVLPLDPPRPIAPAVILGTALGSISILLILLVLFVIHKCRKGKEDQEKEAFYYSQIDESMLSRQSTNITNNTGLTADRKQQANQTQDMYHHLREKESNMADTPINEYSIVDVRCVNLQDPELSTYDHVTVDGYSRTEHANRIELHEQ